MISSNIGGTGMIDGETGCPAHPPPLLPRYTIGSTSVTMRLKAMPLAAVSTCRAVIMAAQVQSAGYAASGRWCSYAAGADGAAWPCVPTPQLHEVRRRALW